MSTQTQTVPSAFIWRRVHSLMGFALVLYIIEHLTTNSQAALWVGADGIQFIRMVNFIHSLPYLKVLEVMLIGVPLLVHGAWGIKYALTSRSNVRSTNGSKASLKYSRNRAYSLQRLSSWILLVGLILHVVQMRFIRYPKVVSDKSHHVYLTKITMDEGLYTLAPRLEVTLVNQKQISSMIPETIPKLSTTPILESTKSTLYEPKKAQDAQDLLSCIGEKKLQNALRSYELSKDQVVAVCSNPGTAFLLNVRDTFKSVWMMLLYTIFVFAAGFHAFNGLWTFLISWGVILSYFSQKKMALICMCLTAGIIFLGLASIWGTYWINLRY